MFPPPGCIASFASPFLAVVLQNLTVWEVAKTPGNGHVDGSAAAGRVALGGPSALSRWTGAGWTGLATYWRPAGWAGRDWPATGWSLVRRISFQHVDRIKKQTRQNTRKHLKPNYAHMCRVYLVPPPLQILDCKSSVLTLFPEYKQPKKVTKKALHKINK